MKKKRAKKTPLTDDQKVLRLDLLEKRRKAASTNAGLAATFAKLLGWRVGIMAAPDRWLARMPEYPDILLVEVHDPIDGSTRVIGWNLHESDFEIADMFPKWEGPMGVRLNSRHFSGVIESLLTGASLIAPSEEALAAVERANDEFRAQRAVDADAKRQLPPDPPWGLDDGSEWA